MKKFLTMLLAMLLCLQVFSTGVVLGDELNTDYITSKIGSSLPNYIEEGDRINLTLDLKNTSNYDLTQVSFTIDSDSSFRINGEGTISLGDMAKGSEPKQQPLDLTYTGSGKDLKFTLRYYDGTNNCVQPQSLFISQASPGSGTPSAPSAPSDPSKYQPKLGISSESSTTTVLAGNTVTVNYPVKNASLYSARFINMTLELEDRQKAPYILDKLELKQTIDSLGPNEIKNAAFEMKVLNTAPEGIYALKVSYQYYSMNGTNYNSTETVYLKVKNNNVMPRLTVDGISMTSAEDAAGGVNLKINLKNIGSLPAKDIKVTLKGLKSGGFMTYNSTDVKYLTVLNGNSSGSVTYLLTVPGSGAASSNELTVKMDYRDEMGTAYSDENQIFLPTDGSSDGKPELSFENIQSPQGAISSNVDFTIGFDLANKGAGKARNIKVTLASDKEVVTRTLSTVVLDSLDKSASKRLSFTLFATDDAVTKNYPVAISLEYEDAYGAKYTATQYVGVFVENGAGKSVPRIIVDKYGFDPVDIGAGEDFKLKLSFLNTSGATVVSNIKATLTSEDGVLTPSNSGNTFYIEAIGSKKSVEKELMLHVKPDAEAKSYVLSVNFDYEDEKGTAITSKETISVPVTQNPRLLTGDLSVPTDTFTGQPVQIYIDFYNMGKSILYNLMVKAEGDFEGQNLSYYVGNFEPGRSDSFDTSIIPKAPGTLKGNVVFSFEDAGGKVSEIKKEFSVNVTEMKQEVMAPGAAVNGVMIGPDGKPINPAAGFRPSILLIGIVVFFVIAALVTFIILRRKHIKRKEMSLDE
jgi:hypothetical protein